MIHDLSITREQVALVTSLGAAKAQAVRDLDVAVTILAAGAALTQVTGFELVGTVLRLTTPDPVEDA